MAENSVSPLTVILPAKRGGEVALSGSYDELINAADRLNQKGIIAVSDTSTGTIRLLISGLKNTSQLNDILGKSIAVEKLENDKDGKDSSNNSIREWIKNRKLKVAGILYLIGDSSLFLSGLTGGKAKEAASGLLWAGGGIASTIYGDPSIDRQIKNVGNAMADFMASQGITPDRNTALYNLNQSRVPNWLRRVNGFLYNHPSEAHNAFYVVGSGTYFQSGMEKLRSNDPKKHAGWWQDMGVGATVGTGSLIGTFVGEKHKENGEKPSNPIEWVKEKPLRVSGFLYMLNNVFSFMSAFAERKEWMKEAAKNPEAAAHNPQRFAHLFKFFTTGVFVISNVFMSLSSRHNSEMDTEHNSFKDDMIGGMAAEVIATQPEEKRSQLISATSIFLSKRYEVAQTPDVWEQILREKIDGLAKSHLAKDNNTEKSPLSLPTGNKSRENTKQTSWTEKIAQAPEVPITSQSL